MMRLSALLLGIFWACAAAAEAPVVLDPKAALALSRAAEGRTLGDFPMLERFRGKPLVISMIYSSCFHACPQTTQTLARAVATARRALGKDSFAVVSVGFDSVHDTPAAMELFARQQGIDWPALPADPATRDRLAADLGFSYTATSRGLDHIAQTTVIDARGRIYRQVYGESFEAPLLVEPLKDLVLGRGAALTNLQSLTDRVRLICTVYDPASGAYRTDYGLFLEIGFGLASVLTIVFLLVRAWRDSRRRTLPPTPAQ
jgi:protein SCO1/2